MKTLLTFLRLMKQSAGERRYRNLATRINSGEISIFQTTRQEIAELRRRGLINLHGDYDDYPDQYHGGDFVRVYHRPS